MVQNITYEIAVRLIRCMNEHAPIPADHDYKWFAFYAGKQVPDNTVYGRYSRNEDGILGIIARERVQTNSEVVEMERLEA